MAHGGRRGGGAGLLEVDPGHQLSREVFNALAALGRDDPDLRAAQVFREDARRVASDLRGEVSLRDGDHPGDLIQLRVVGAELTFDELVVGDRVRRAAVDNVEQDAAAADVLEELEAEPVALRGAFDEARQVGQGEALIAGVDDPKHRFERGERVVGDLGLRVGDGREEGGLARIREADEADIREEAELQADRNRLAFLTLLGIAGRLVRRGGEAFVAPAAPSAKGDDDFLAHGFEVRDQVSGIGLVDDGADWDIEVDILAVRPMAEAGAAVSAVSRLELFLRAVLFEGVDIVDGAQIDAATAAAVTTIRPALGDELLAVVADHAMAPVAALHVDLDRVQHLQPSEQMWRAEGSLMLLVKRLIKLQKCFNYLIQEVL